MLREWHLKLNQNLIEDKMSTFTSEKDPVEANINTNVSCFVHRINGTIVSSRIMGQCVSFFVADRTDLIQKEHFEGKFYESGELKIVSEFFHLW